MSDPRPEPPHPPDPRPAPVDEAALALSLPRPAPTDDSATVISKSLPRPSPPDEAIAVGVRGRQLAHFELMEPIGVGGMAAVLKARDTQLDRTVALKILPPDMALDPENVRRFHQEARSAAKLDHENIARVFFCGEDQRLHFIAFEFVEGENLRTVMERRGRLPVAEAIQYVLQIAAGLAHACSRGVVHRDIKPSNIIITPTGRAKLVDMGLARSLDPQRDMGLTQSGVTLGTFDYISPEQALEPRDADGRSDIYSLGCTLYHMITGQPPVPEGTAARKLHHHQHVKPPDPRELVPNLPDEVAVVLDRMIAKDPRARYQTPEHLVQHLLLIGKKLGVASETPEGVLFVDAAFPPPPSRTGLWLVPLAAVAVLVLVFLADPGGQSSYTPDNGSGTRPAAKDAQPGPQKDDAAAPSHAKGPDSEPGHQPVLPVVVARYDADEPTPRDLAAFLQQNRGVGEIEILLARDLDLSARDERPDPGLVVQARKVTIRPKVANKKPTLRLSYDGRPSRTLWAALTLECEESLVEGLRVVIDSRFSDTEMLGLWIKGGAKHVVRECEFCQAQPTYDERKRMASVVIEAVRASRPKLHLTRCGFVGFQKLEVKAEAGGPDKLEFLKPEAGGEDAVVRRGAASVRAADCVFGPHSAAFRLEGPCPDPESVRIEHSSVLAAGRSAVFQVHDGSADLEMSHSLVARAGTAADSDVDAAALIRQAGTAGRVTFRGTDNRYYRLDAFWVGATGASSAEDWAGFTRRLRQDEREDTSRILDVSPWKDEHPLRLLEQQRLADAFQVNDRNPDLRQSDQPTKHLVGAEWCGGTDYLVAGLPDVDKRSGDRHERIVDPTKDDPTNGIYRGLDQAVLASKPGDVVLIRHNGLLPVKGISLEDAAVNLTIRPAAGFKPVLTLDNPSDRDAALFRVLDATLKLEGLHFAIEPGKDGFRSQAVVSLLREGHCHLKDCVVTLDPAGRGASLAVAVVAEADGVMKMDGARAHPIPKLTIEGCLVRGDGDLVWERAGRSLDLDARQTLVVLGGSLLAVDAGAEVATVGQITARLSQVTTYLGGNLIRLRAPKDFEALAAVSCKPSDCLFVAAGGKALIHLEGPETGEEKIKKKLTWEAGRNAYGNFGDMLDQQPPGEEMRPPAIRTDRWRTFTGETNSEFPRIKFADAPPAEGPFTRVVPAQFKVMSPDMTNFGVDASQLPRPFDADKK